MKRSKIGRNDPCQCGSGKKYKNCCLALEGLVDKRLKPFERCSQLLSTVKLKVDQQYDAQIRKARQPLQEKFMRLSVTQQLPQEQEPIFSDWLWFDMTDSEGLSMGTEYLQEHGDFMEEPLRQCLQALNASYLSLYTPTNSEGDILHLRDYFTGHNHKLILKEPLNMNLDEFQELLLGRLVVLPDGTVFSGIVLSLKIDSGQDVFIKQHIDYLHALHPADDLSQILKNNAEILFGLYEHAREKIYLNLNDIRVIQWQDSPPDLTDKISPNFIHAHNTSGMSWYELKDSLGTARIGIHDTYMVFYANILDDIRRLEDWLDEIMPGGKWEIIHTRLLFEPPSAELKNIWYIVVKEQETERWLDTIHSELNDKTPREVLQAENGLTQLLTMLDDFASQAAGNKHSQDLFNYMRARIS